MAATKAEDLTWNLLKDIYELFPAHPENDPSALVHATEQFEDGSGIIVTATEGNGLDTTYSSGEVTIENTSVSGDTHEPPTVWEHQGRCFGLVERLLDRRVTDVVETG